MRVCLLNGLNHDDSSPGEVHRCLVDELKAPGYEVREFTLRDLKVADCVGCFGCWLKTPGICVIDDAARDVARAIVQSDLLIALTPVTFGGYSYHLKKGLDRSIGNITPFFRVYNGETHHLPRYSHFPDLLVIGIMEKSDEDAANVLARLVDRNARNMHHPRHGVIVVDDSMTGEQVHDRISSSLERLGGVH